AGGQGHRQPDQKYSFNFHKLKISTSFCGNYRFGALMFPWGNLPFFNANHFKSKDPYSIYRKTNEPCRGLVGTRRTRPSGEVRLVLSIEKNECCRIYIPQRPN